MMAEYEVPVRKTHVYTVVADSPDEAYDMVHNQDTWKSERIEEEETLEIFKKDD